MNFLDTCKEDEEDCGSNFFGNSEEPGSSFFNSIFGSRSSACPADEDAGFFSRTKSSESNSAVEVKPTVTVTLPSLLKSNEISQNVAGKSNNTISRDPVTKHSIESLSPKQQSVKRPKPTLMHKDDLALPIASPGHNDEEKNDNNSMVSGCKSMMDSIKKSKEPGLSYHTLSKTVPHETSSSKHQQRSVHFEFLSQDKEVLSKPEILNQSQNDEVLFKMVPKDEKQLSTKKPDSKVFSAMTKLANHPEQKSSIVNNDLHHKSTKNYGSVCNDTNNDQCFAEILSQPDYNSLRDELANLTAAKVSGNFVYQVAASVEALMKCSESVKETAMAQFQNAKDLIQIKVKAICDQLQTKIDENNSLHQNLVSEKLANLSQVLDEIKTADEELTKFKQLLRSLSININTEQ